MTDMPDLQLSKRESKKDFDQVEPAELIYEDISVVASVNE